MLVYLALNGHHPVPREVLAALFWPDESDKTARNNLRQALYQLRGLLGDSKNGDDPYLIVTRQTVQFNPESDTSMDVAQFLDAIESRDLEKGTALYHGELLPGFPCDSLPFEDWLRQERESLHHLALEAMVEVTRDYLGNGEHDLAHALARRQLALEPWRESAHHQLMQAYAQAGDRANALAQFEILRQTLWDELGVEPAEETTALIEAIKAGRYELSAGVDRIPPPVRFQHNLPASTTPLIGREIELENISRLLLEEHRRLVTIVGPGGMGKTRLALAMGAIMLQDFPDGVFFVDLAPLTRPEEIMLAIAAAVEYQAPDTTAELGPQLLAMLSRRHLLLIMDNFEHLLAGAGLVNEILQRCPKVSLLVTSRQRLNLASESRYELGGLDFPPSPSPEYALGYMAVQLFVDSGHRANSQFDLTVDNIADVIRICQLVQGIPLGLLLASAWLELLSPVEIAAEIEASLDFLTADLADLPARQRSMLAIFKGSWQMMTPGEQAVLAKLSVFRGGFTRQAAEEVAGANLRILLSLVNKSLLQRQISSGRFTMHELLRQYSTERLQEIKPTGQAALAHCRYFAELVNLEVWQAVGFHPIHLPRKLAEDRDNIGSAWYFAVENGLAQELAWITKGVVAFLMAQGIQPDAIPKESINALDKRGIPDTDPTMLYLRLLELSYRIGIEGHDKIRPRLLELVPLVDKFGDPELRFWTYERLTMLTYDVIGYDSEMITEWKKACQAAQETEKEYFMKMTQALDLNFRVGVMGLVDGVLPELEELLAYFERDFPQSNIVFSLLLAISTYYQILQQFDKAIRYGQRCLSIAKSWGDLYWISLADDKLANIYVDMGRPNLASLQHLDTLDWHLAVGQEWQTLGNIWAKCAFNSELLGGREEAVPILAVVYYHPEVVPFHRMQIEEARERFEEEIGSAVYAAAWEKGREMDYETAVELVRAALGNN